MPARSGDERPEPGPSGATMATLSKLFAGMSSSARLGDQRAVEGACQASLLLLRGGEDEGDAPGPGQVLAALIPFLEELPPTALGPVAVLVHELCRRGAPAKRREQATRGLWDRSPEVLGTQGSDRYWRGVGELLTGQPKLRRTLQPSRALCASTQDSERLFSALLRAPQTMKLLVLHPELVGGFHVSAQGVLDVAQLQVLLAGILVGDPVDGLLPGDRPSEAALRACGSGVLPLQPPTASANWNIMRPHQASISARQQETQSPLLTR